MSRIQTRDECVGIVLSFSTAAYAEGIIIDVAGV